MKMFEEYQVEVYAEYLKSKEDNIVLANPKPSSLRDEAIVFLKNNREGAEVLRFFSDDGTKQGKLDIDKFKPVQRFLLGQTSEPTNRVVELIAWLIDFQPRPFEAWRNNKLSGGEKKNKEDKKLPTDGETKDIPPQEQPEKEIKGEPQKVAKKLNFIQRTGIVATLGLIMGVAYWKGVPPDGCMYWTGTEYEAVDCDAQIPNTQILALNQQKLDHFKKITLPDTMTFNSLNKVWYSKINNEVEFFTTKGKHPLKTDRTLKPITTYILVKYGNNRIITLTNQPDTTEKD